MSRTAKTLPPQWIRGSRLRPIGMSDERQEQRELEVLVTELRAELAGLQQGAADKDRRLSRLREELDRAQAEATADMECLQRQL